ncbi:DUF3108 domain-containing protein [Gluconacetobacter sacchari]|uniref:DUF3108 domain-containing protein n=2 Tax=Gluconacetobacter sacchari TaxID=92759 RepID=A0A7W4NJP0_9PROT|nr:DUF3108 domain-containing protein [Gluconacetobacter sacchari]MBB2159026.1 DUF3108 domain-containing protein [Gluconacetobacter sacchari]GBQ31504.1 hypothetical protein AA12717_3790 [Gluconacetobacter sacchari DSM 12717]
MGLTRKGFARGLAALALAATLGAPVPGARAADDPAQIVHVYGVYNHGFRALTIAARYAVTPDGYAVRSTTRSGGLLGLLVRMNITAQATGRFVPDGVQPLTFDSAGYSRGADRHVVLDYSGGQTRIALQTPPEPSRDPIPATDLAPAMDSLSALMRLQQTVRAHHQCDGSATVFDGARLLRMSAHTIGTQDMDADSRQPYKGPALRCDFNDLQIAGFRKSDGPDAAARKPVNGSVWFQDVPGDGLTIVRIAFDHPKLGHMTVLLLPDAA